MAKETVQTGLRLCHELNGKIEAKAKAIGLSKNALFTVLIDLGFRVFENPNLQNQLGLAHEQPRIPQQIAEQQIPTVH